MAGIKTEIRRIIRENEFIPQISGSGICVRCTTLHRDIGEHVAHIDVTEFRVDPDPLLHLRGPGIRPDIPARQLVTDDVGSGGCRIRYCIGFVVILGFGGRVGIIGQIRLHRHPHIARAGVIEGVGAVFYAGGREDSRTIISLGLNQVREGDSDSGEGLPLRSRSCGGLHRGVLVLIRSTLQTLIDSVGGIWGKLVEVGAVLPLAVIDTILAPGNGGNANGVVGRIGDLDRSVKELLRRLDDVTDCQGVNRIVASHHSESHGGGIGTSLRGDAAALDVDAAEGGTLIDDLHLRASLRLLHRQRGPLAVIFLLKVGCVGRLLGQDNGELYIGAGHALQHGGTRHRHGAVDDLLRQKRVVGRPVPFNRGSHNARLRSAGGRDGEVYALGCFPHYLSGLIPQISLDRGDFRKVDACAPHLQIDRSGHGQLRGICILGNQFGGSDNAGDVLGASGIGVKPFIFPGDGDLSLGLDAGLIGDTHGHLLREGLLGKGGTQSTSNIDRGDGSNAGHLIVRILRQGDFQGGSGDFAGVVVESGRTAQTKRAGERLLRLEGIVSSRIPADRQLHFDWVAASSGIYPNHDGLGNILQPKESSAQIAGNLNGVLDQLDSRIRELLNDLRLGNDFGLPLVREVVQFAVGGDSQRTLDNLGIGVGRIVPAARNSEDIPLDNGKGLCLRIVVGVGNSNRDGFVL